MRLYYQWVRRFSCVCLWLLAALLVTAQPAKTTTGYAAIYQAAEKWYHSDNATDKTDSLALLNYQRVALTLIDTRQYNETLVDCLLKSGILNMSASANEAALDNFRKAIFYWQRGLQLPDSLLFRPYLYAGSVHYNLNELDSAIFFYKKADNINSRYPALAESERLYNKLGALYYETGELKKSIPYFEKALSLVTAANPPNAHFFIVNYKNNIATALLKMGALQQSLDMYKDLLKYKINSDQLYSNIGSIYYEQGSLKESLQYFRLVKENTPEKYNHLSMVFLKNGDTDSAAYYNGKAAGFYANPATATGIDYVLLLKYRADIQVRQHQYATAIRNYQAALTRLVPRFTSSQPADNPTQFTGLQHFAILFDVLFAKAQALKQDKIPNSSSFALHTLAAALELSHYVERTYTSDEARLFLKTKMNAACGEAVTLALQLYGETKDEQLIAAAFGYVENNKASVLQAGLQQLEISGIAGLPTGLVAAEKNTRAMIARLSIGIAQATDTAAKASLQRKISDAELALSAVQQKLDDNPAYQKLKFASVEKGWEKIKMQLQSKTDHALLSYYYTGNQLSCFYITNRQAGCISIPLPADFIVKTNTLRKLLEIPEGASLKQLNQLSAELYQLLLQPVMEKIKDRKHLVVIPFNEISYIPFELLNDGSQPMLQRFAISYLYSANFLNNETKAIDNGYSVLAMAPFSSTNASNLILPALPASLKEIEGLPGKQVTGEGATKNAFISLSGQYPILHLATHAVANDTDPLGCYIEFYAKQAAADSTHRLYEKEIYNLEMQQARLVILSACETGNGMLVNGEGIVSLSRSFSYAGCKSVVTSLWKAHDAATAFIMKQLHVYLQKGYAKDQALQKAKLDYLNNSQTDERQKTPAFWAHMVLIGDTQAITEANTQSSYILFAVAIIALLVFIFWRIKKRAQQSAR